MWPVIFIFAALATPIYGLWLKTHWLELDLAKGWHFVALPGVGLLAAWSWLASQLLNRVVVAQGGEPIGIGWLVQGLLIVAGLGLLLVVAYRGTVVYALRIFERGMREHGGARTARDSSPRRHGAVLATEDGEEARPSRLTFKLFRRSNETAWRDEETETQFAEAWRPGWQRVATSRRRFLRELHQTLLGRRGHDWHPRDPRSTERRFQRKKDLVILRVFGCAGRTQLLVDIQEIWRKIGCSWTIASPDYFLARMARDIEVFRMFFGFESRGGGGRLGLAFLFGYPPALVVWLALGLSSSPLTFPLVVLGAVWAFVGFRHLESTVEIVFNRGQQEALRMTTSEGEMLPDGTFEQVAYACRDDQWKAVVTLLATKAEVVAMDLRGFDRTRLGSSYELDHLMEHYPLNRVLFLVDPTTDRDGLLQQLRESYDGMSSDSPNLVDEPVANVYIVGDRSREDLRQITETLCNMAIPQSSTDQDVPEPTGQFVSQPSFVPDGQQLPPVSHRLRFPDGYVWLIYDAVVGHGKPTHDEQGRTIASAVGRRSVYYHVLETDLVYEGPLRSPAGVAGRPHAPARSLRAQHVT